MEERFKVLVSQVPDDGEAINTTVVYEVRRAQVVTSEMDEAEDASRSKPVKNANKVVGNSAS